MSDSQSQIATTQLGGYIWDVTCTEALLREVQSRLQTPSGHMTILSAIHQVDHEYPQGSWMISEGHRQFDLTWSTPDAEADFEDIPCKLSSEDIRTVEAKADASGISPAQVMWQQLIKWIADLTPQLSEPHWQAQLAVSAGWYRQLLAAARRRGFDEMELDVCGCWRRCLRSAPVKPMAADLGSVQLKCPQPLALALSAITRREQIPLELAGKLALENIVASRRVF